MEKKIILPFQRCDGFVDEGRDYSDSIVKEYTLIDHVEMIGEKDTDFVIKKEPTLINEYDIQKQINEAAKSATLEGQIDACLRAGGNPETDFVIDASKCGDISGMPEDIIDAKKMADAGIVASQKLPDELKKDNLSQDELNAYIEKYLIEHGLVKKDVSVGTATEEIVSEGGKK